jgi:amino acid adenylation domain-containing protein
MSARNIEDIYPLSPMQQGMLFHSIYDPESGMYVEQMSCALRGSLSLDAFERAWRRVISRHTPLRTAFVWQDLDEPLQVVQRQVSLPLEQHDWRALTPAAQAAQLESFQHEERRRGLDLSEAPLMRLTLIRLADDRYQFVWTHHHLLIDGWSVPLLFQEVFQLYEAFRQGQDLPLPSSRPYRDYIAWLQGQDVAQTESFWREWLAGIEAPTPLIVDRAPDRAPASAEEASQALRATRLPAEITAALQALARQHQLTINTIVQGAWALLLSRYSGEPEVVFGATVSGRPVDLPWAETMIGLFINTLPVRASVPPDAALLTWLKELQARQVELRQYEYSPLVQVQEWSEIPRGRPLFESILVFENYPVDASLREQRGSLQIEDVRSFSRTNYPLTVVVAPGRELSLEIAYDPGRFDSAAVERMLGHLRTLLASIAADPTQRLAAIPLLTEAERQQLLIDWKQTATPFPDGRCAHELFEAQAARAPEAIALVFEEQRLTYRELNARANQLAHYLRKLGVGPEVLVGICIERSPEMIVGALGVLKAGGAYLPLDPSYPPERIAFMLEDAQTTLLLTATNDETADKEQNNPPVFSVVDLIADWPIIAEESANNPAHAATAGNLAYVIYTSGSTGRPKGVLLQHRGLCNFMAVQARDFDIGPESRALLFASFSFDAAVAETFTALTHGATLYLARREMLLSEPDLLAFLRGHAITNATLPPSLLALLPEANLPALRSVAAAGEACSVEIAARWASGRRFFNGYGPTEATVGVCWQRVDDIAALETRVPIGRPIGNTCIYLLDRHLQPVPIGVPGEIYISSVGLARGYLNRPELTAERFIPNPFATTDDRRPTTDNGADADSGQRSVVGGRLYKTGDLACWRADGALEFLARADDQVKIRGFRLELGELEAALRQHPHVQDAVALAREDTPGDRRLVAYIVPTNDERRTTNDELTDSSALVVGHWSLVDELRAFLNQRLPEYMLPSAFVLLEAWPLTPNGKIDRKALPAPDRTLFASEYVAPRTPDEQLIAAVWAQVLNVPRIGAADDFFELGGHSLLATQLLSRLCELFEVELPLRSLFEHSTLAAQAALIQEARRAQSGLSAPPIARAERDGELPLSFSQQRLWFLDQLEPNSPFYNNPVAVRLSGALDIDALERSLNEIVQRHEALRTSFAALDGRPVQVIAPAGAEATLLQVADLRGELAAEREGSALRLATAEAQFPFDLAGGPLLRVTLLVLDDQEHIVLLTLHHIVTDGWSIGILIREIATLYQAFAAGRPSPLPPLPIQYADFAAWQRQWLQGEALVTQLAYWTEQLRGCPDLLELPTDRPRQLVHTSRGASRALQLPKDLSDGLAALSRQSGTTLFMTLLAAFQTLLARYSGQEDICVGTPIANRTRVELEGLIGFFANTLVLRGDLSGNPSFSQLLKQAREACLGAYAHQDLPFEMLVEALQPSRTLSHTPLFQVMLVLDNAPLEQFELPDLSLRVVDSESGTARFDLTLALAESSEGLAGSIEYNTDLFDAATIDRLIGHFQTLLEGIVADPEQPISSLPLLTATERHQLLVDWNRTDAAFPEICFHQLFEQQAEQHPDAPAVSFEGAILTYAQLDARANQLARHLQTLGVVSEALVALAIDRSLDLVVAILASLKAGAAFLPLDPAYPPERIAFMFHDAQPAILLTQAALRDQLPGNLPPVVALDADWPAVDKQPSTVPLGAATVDSPAYVIYTSGSTGQPKGAVLGHRGLCNLAHWQRGAFGLAPGKRVLQFSALSFDAAVWELAMALGSGATLALAPRATLASAPELQRLLRDQSITHVTLPPSLLAVLPPTDLPSLEVVIAAGEACPADLVARWAAGRRFVNAYGPTETTVCAATYLCDSQDAGPPPIGRPLANIQLYVLDQHGQPAPIGVPGELYIGGVAVAHGYLNRPELSAERFVPNPFPTTDNGANARGGRWSAVGRRLYRTGDLVRYRADGNIEFLGRIDQQVKLRGFRIELGEIEAVLRRHEGVQDTLVLAREDTPGDKRLVAYVVPTNDERRTTNDELADSSSLVIGQSSFVGELRAFLKQRLPEYMLPSAFVLLVAWPLTPSGKIDRKALPTPDGTRQLERAYIAPRTPTEAQLAALAAELLGLEQVGVEDSFFELGGHSLLATQLLARARAQFQVEVPLRMLFEQPTIAGLAAAIEQARETSDAPQAPAIVAIARDSRRMRRSALAQPSETPEPVVADSEGIRNER